MKVLVTGATGFTGGHLARHLRRQGHDVAALVRPSSLRKTEALTREGVTIREGDLTDAPAVRAACEGIDVVFHIAATYREAGQTDAAYTRINVDGTRHVLEGALANGVKRVVHCSTGGVHGHIEHPPANENAPFAPGDVYQRTKLEAELLAARFGRERGLDVVVARPIGIYGPGDLRFLKMFRGIARGRFPMLGRGQVFYHLTYIDDLCRGFELCGTVAGAAGRTYILAGPEYTTLQRLVELVAQELGVRPPWIRLPVWPVWIAGAVCEAVCVPLRIEPPLYRRRVDFYSKSRAFDTARARRELGYNPVVDLKTGIHLTAQWYRSQGLL
ncbi:MAG TPA: NAD-dependent epimerase/dehydratase family protein [Vicinamibacterales bacterium]